MKHPADTMTEELFPAPRRGRPASGKAMTAAERKRQQRAALPGYDMEISLSNCSDTALHTAMQRALSRGDANIADMLAAEFMRRTHQRTRA